MVAIARVFPVAVALLALLGSRTPLQSQESDVDAVKRVVRGESDAYFRRDSLAWKNYHIQDSNAVVVGMGSGGYAVDVGWDAWGPGVLAEMKKNPKPIEIKFDDVNHRVRIDGALAFAEYDQRFAIAPDTTFHPSRQYRVLEKRDGNWKILSGGSFHLDTYEASPSSIEGRLRGVAATLLGAKKTGEAIEILELNAKLFPNSLAAFQNLGWAYEQAGDSKRAIRSYQQALSIDPKDEESKLSLLKLRALAACAHGSKDGPKCQL